MLEWEDLLRTFPMPLAPYAITDANSKGRRFGVVETADRNQFQRDYTRVLHSQAFRRLQQKTQVFSANLGDLFRTRITHSLEVDQVSRSVAQQLGLNEDLCGVLAIAHDIGPVQANRDRLSVTVHNHRHHITRSQINAQPQR